MASNYVIWDSAPVEGACVLAEMRGIESRLRINKGERFGDEFPEGVTFRMNDDFPDDILLVDNLINTDMLNVVSRPLMEFVDSKGLSHIEFYPVSIIDHRDEVASSDYFILNPVDPPSCLDFEASGATFNPISKSIVDRVERLALDEDSIEPDRAIFRPAGFYRVTLVHRELAREMDDEGFVGNRWVELDAYPEG